MASSAKTPISPAVHALASQVGGHPGVMATEDGSLLIKPASPGEIAFYETLKSATKKSNPHLVKLREFTPEYLGTLRLEGQIEPGSEEKGVLRIKPVGKRSESLVMKNLTYTFSKPNILDCKLGRVLYDHQATPDKVERMKQTARSSTSWKSGLRLTGFQVHDNHTGLPVNTPKSYGRSIQISDLPDGVAQFFPVAIPDVNGEAGGVPNEESRMGLPAQTLYPMMLAIRSEVAQIRAALKSTNLRMVGGSVLIVYEADWKKAEEGLKHYLQEKGSSVEEGFLEFDEAEYANVRDDEEDEDEIAKVEEQVHLEEAGRPPVGDLDGGGDDLEDEDEVDADEDDDEDDEEKEEIPIPFVVKVIDFAHTRLVEPHLGYDKGVDRGLDTVLKLLTTRIKQVKEKL